MIRYTIKMQHDEKTFEALSRMQYDLFCSSNRITRTILSILLIAAGIVNFTQWWGILLAAYGCYLTTSTYSSANHTAHRLAEQIKNSGMPFPSSRYEFSDDHIEIYVLPAGKKEVSLRYTDFDKLGEDHRFFYLFRDSYGGYMIPKEELGDEKEVTAFREFLEQKSGKTVCRKTIPLLRAMQMVTRLQRRAG